ncbi:hypothetical protein N7456_013119 [Penicillium angulare]|uniref:Zn(2)-C6 fungal-type domain-containing protein n=1 Tax=Penicillium angulare TaxID=116970 RepID=A0A9W9EKX0_9EURO|nr:hypothetical protein N7456_013119 [Penicillium angulare]
MPDSDRRTLRACDSCKRRKVRCNGQSKCQQCTHSGLPCTYTNTSSDRPRKKNVRRGAVIAECRTLNLRPGKSATLLDHEKPSYMPSSNTSRFNPAFFFDLLGDYEQYVFPMSPVIPADEIREMIGQMDENKNIASFVYIYAAATLDLTRSEPVQEAPGTRDRIATLLTRSLELRRRPTLDSHVSIVDVMSGVFTEMAFCTLRRPDLAFIYLREAISLLYMLNVESEEALANLDPMQRARLQRAYWECFVHERFTALTENRPPCLGPLKTHPDHDATLPPDVETGWQLCIDNFRLVDREFLDFWLGGRSEVTADWIEDKQRHLEDDEWHCEVSRLPQMQQADLVITRHWLRTLTWQIALSNTLLSSSPGSSLLLSLSFPLRLSNQLRQFLMTIPRDLVGIHGSGILKKLFEIASTITDVVLNVPHASGDETVRRIHDILFLKEFLFSFTGFQNLWPEVLTQKFQLIRDRYPEIKEMELLR